jgi:predicted nucleotidyltransferase
MRPGGEIFLEIVHYAIIAPTKTPLRVSLMALEGTMDMRDRELVLEFKNRLSQDTVKRIKRLIVFGSRAKGEATADSDLDLVALVDEFTPQLEAQLEDVAYQVMWDHDFKPIISLKVFQEASYADALGKGYSFYRRVEAEGIAV